MGRGTLKPRLDTRSERLFMLFLAMFLPFICPEMAGCGKINSPDLKILLFSDGVYEM